MYSAKCISRMFAVLAVVFALPTASYAHPMGNFSINHYARIEVGTQQVDLEYIIDMAEIPTFQETEVNGLATNKSDPGVAVYLTRQADTLKNGLTLELNGRPLRLNTVSRQVIFPPGAGGLPTMKMGFHYRTKLAPGDARRHILYYNDANYPGRAGWKEVIAVAAPGTALSNSSVPSWDRSAELSNYLTDLLHTPPQTLAANLTFSASPLGPSAYERAATVDTGELKLAANQQKTPRSAFTELVTSNRTDAAFVLMAAAIAAMLEGFHAFEPGHGKTLVAAYLVGSRGTARHSVLLASVVTASHTISVIYSESLLCSHLNGSCLSVYIPGSGRRRVCSLRRWDSHSSCTASLRQIRSPRAIIPIVLIVTRMAPVRWFIAIRGGVVMFMMTYRGRTNTTTSSRDMRISTAGRMRYTARNRRPRVQSRSRVCSCWGSQAELCHARRRWWCCSVHSQSIGLRSDCF